MPPLRIDIWSDIACPWCYVGKRRFEAALGRFPGGGEVTVRLRAFELDPSAPREKEPGLAYADRLAHKYGTTVERGQEMIDTMTAAGAGDGLELRFDRIRPGNTFDAHRLLHLAAEHDRALALEERLFRAYLTEGEPIGDPATLARLATEAGLDPSDVQAVLDGDGYADAVRADEIAARELGIHSVPCFVLDGRYAVSGAQTPEVLLDALRTAAETPASGEAAADAGAEDGEGAACDDDGCS